MAQDGSVEAKVRYRLAGRPLGRGSYAEVFRATAREGGQEVALKRALNGQQPRDRIKREIAAQRMLAHPNIMPIWDSDPGSKWYTMPLAAGTLSELKSNIDEEDFASILFNIAEALDVAHQVGLLHRDISPQNILALTGHSLGAFRWVVADWGMVRPSPDDMSRVLTRTGQRMGTPGFDAPELDVDPHTATASADVYSLGRVAAWFLTGESPRSGVPLLPDGDLLHWRPFVRACTQQDVAQRVASMTDLRELLQRVFVSRDEPLLQQLSRLTESLLAGDAESLEPLFSLAEINADNPDLYFDHLALIPSALVRSWTRSNPSRAARVGERMARHLSQSPWDDRDVEYAATPLGFILSILKTLLDERQLGEAQDLAGDYFAAEVVWSHAPQRIRTLDWLADLDDASATVVAAALGASPEARSYYTETTWRGRSVVLAALLNT